MQVKENIKKRIFKNSKKVVANSDATDCTTRCIAVCFKSASKKCEKNDNKRRKIRLHKKMKNFLVLLYCRSFEPKMKHD
jgi:hypothetical protein